MKKLIMAAIGLATILTACSSASQPGAAALATGTTSPESAAGSSYGGTAVGSIQPVVGVNLYALHDHTAAQTKEDGVRTLSYIKNDLHASAVDIVWDIFAPSRHGNSVVTTEDTLTAANVGILTQLAYQYGLAVEYRPMLFVQTSGNTWEGFINPADPVKWFDSYYEQNLPYLKMAQRYHISEFVIGTEMKELTPSNQWAPFLARAAKVFTGQISYTQWDGIYFPPDTELPPTALTGMDMYEKLDLPSSASTAEVTAAYEKFFTDVPGSLLARTAIQETGIQARDGAYANPPNLGTEGTLNESVQYNYFIAGCQTVKRFHLRGIFFWKVDLSDYPLTHPASSLSTFEGRQGAVAISKCASIINS
jgi:hypothetical protein